MNRPSSLKRMTSRRLCRGYKDGVKIRRATAAALSETYSPISLKVHRAKFFLAIPSRLRIIDKLLNQVSSGLLPAGGNASNVLHALAVFLYHPSLSSINNPIFSFSSSDVNWNFSGQSKHH
uniref:Uncharacterized protein n=1 Tax=Coccidioides posadasii RMSCC 3488 TaxID=454284 RepID=A0A0J6F7C9_COCPO|nr:hypothetical protein CPAG_01186 [Coccidioides posadasii RMSCC 3488]